MSKLYENYKTSPDAEANGVWTVVGESEFLLARMGGANKRYQRAMTQAMKPHMRELQLNLIDEETMEPITRRVFLDTILLGWRTRKDDGTYEEGVVYGPDDLPVPFSKDAANTLFNDLPDLYAHLREMAQSFQNFRAADLETAAKN